MYATSAGDLRKIKMLLDLGARPDLKDDTGKSALDSINAIDESQHAEDHLATRFEIRMIGENSIQFACEHNEFGDYVWMCA